MCAKDDEHFIYLRFAVALTGSTVSDASILSHLGIFLVKVAAGLVLPPKDVLLLTIFGLLPKKNNRGL